MVQQNESQMKTIENDTKDYKNTLRLLYLPFPALSNQNNSYIDNMGSKLNYPYNYNNTMLFNNPRESHVQGGNRFSNRSEIMVGSPNMK